MVAGFSQASFSPIQAMVRRERAELTSHARLALLWRDAVMGENALGIGARPGLLTRASRRILSWQARQIPAIEYRHGLSAYAMAILLVAAGTSVDDLNLLRIL